MRMPKNINDWETTEDWENIWVTGRRYTNIFNEGVAQANRGNAKEFVRILSSLADITEKPHEDNLMALPEDPNDEVVANAQFHLANFYLFGHKETETGKVIKTKKNTKKALYYMTLAAENGNMGAQQNLGTMYEEGITPDGKRIPEISVDWKTALKWFHLSAKQGSELAKKDGKNLYKKMKNASN